ncbi:hypothetical protein BBO99_00001281 [Phytophthora kernoviae]|uniref:Dynein attachment factor N-terminal domain-containing protein n=2 Tax=Phytophthora kernoviae TaxID=325452 RepID=A0A3R7KY31_9STRA|nr:hypothetical protein G195_006108 [Phytophthora kernoviae 00238/432]KAG2531574.1 hypothetical protein JM16_001036 [Phytophthora kernoviae]KAG2532481.1 hypothetical protein JM18_001118 [Phytophthora kernoviae]RLN44287.1 hypothetical protein BBI17_001108 [Phytophthora kernoviae]RLN84493.1 hypothetical protein BBO99_00001281 [Phytophthora kernoviae]
MTKKTAKQLISIEHGAFNTAALQQELAQALEDDRIYKLTDSMKKRAIHTAANYDEFRNLVACADLKPISQKELRDFSKAERQTNISFKKKTRKNADKNRQIQPAAPVLDVPPKTAVDFCRNWKRYLKTIDAKFRYLQLTSPERLGKMFKSDMDSDLMAEIIHALLVSLNQDTASVGSEDIPPTVFALQIMEALTQTARFSLILDFFDSHQLEEVQELFKLIESTGDPLDQHHQETLVSIKQMFRLDSLHKTTKCTLNASV